MGRDVFMVFSKKLPTIRSLFGFKARMKDGIIPIITETVLTAAVGRSGEPPPKKVLVKRRIPAGRMIKLRNFRR